MYNTPVDIQLIPFCPNHIHPTLVSPRFLPISCGKVAENIMVCRPPCVRKKKRKTNALEALFKGIWLQLFETYHNIPLIFVYWWCTWFFFGRNTWGELPKKIVQKLGVNSKLITNLLGKFAKSVSALFAHHGRLCWQHICCYTSMCMLVPLRALACCKSQWYFLKGDSPCGGCFLFCKPSWGSHLIPFCKAVGKIS